MGAFTKVRKPVFSSVPTHRHVPHAGRGQGLVQGVVAAAELVQVVVHIGDVLAEWIVGVLALGVERLEAARHALLREVAALGDDRLDGLVGANPSEVGYDVLDLPVGAAHELDEGAAQSHVEGAVGEVGRVHVVVDGEAFAEVVEIEVVEIYVGNGGTPPSAIITPSSSAIPPSSSLPSVVRPIPALLLVCSKVCEELGVGAPARPAGLGDLERVGAMEGAADGAAGDAALVQAGSLGGDDDVAGVFELIAELGEVATYLLELAQVDLLAGGIGVAGADDAVGDT